MSKGTDPLVLDFVEWIAGETVAGFGMIVSVTEAGEALLRAHRRLD